MSKIVIVLHDLRGGGAEKMMVRLANQLARGEDHVELVLLTQGGVNKAFVSPAVTLVELKAARSATSLLRLRRYLRQADPDAILSVLTHVNVVCAVACASLGISHLLTVSERNTFSLDKSVNDNISVKLAYWLAPLVYRLLPNPVIAVSRGVADDLLSQPLIREKDVTTAPNPVITEATLAASLQPATHSWLVDKSTPVIVSVGRLSHQKGFDMLLDAFSRIRHLGFRLVIFGEGELREDFERQIEDLDLTFQVDLPGYCDNPLAEIRQADLYVLSSRFEGSPNGLVEAMSVGVPVVAFNCPHGPAEILQAGKVAPLVEYQNVEKLAEAMADSLLKPADSARREQIVSSVSCFHAEHAARQYRDLLGVI